MIVICGPTGSGKGQLARDIAGRLDGELISADSRKIYRKFNIGTAKTPASVQAGIVHHLMDVCDPHEVFAAGRYAELAHRAIDDITQRNRLPIVVGGTGLYIRVLLYGIVDAPIRDDNLREQLLTQESSDPGSLYSRLCDMDPVTAKRLPASDLVRIVRALEVCIVGKVPISELQETHGFSQQRYRSYQIAPLWSKETLYQRINERVDRMMSAGWLDEVDELIQLGFSQTPAFQSVGYRHLAAVLAGERDLEEAVASIKTEHRRYARRQLMWFRNVNELHWIEMPADVNALVDTLRDFLAQ